MNLYLVNSTDGVFIVRAPSGPRAMQLIGVDEADITILSPEGEEELIVALDGPGQEAEGVREIEVTCLSDKERRFRNLDTGSIRFEPLRKHGQS